MSEKKITLPSGATVTLKDPAELKVKDRKRVMKAADTEGGETTRALALRDAIVALSVKEWSFDLLPPSVNVESLDELSMADYDALAEATEDIQNSLFPTLAKTEKNEKDPKAITENSND